MAAATLTPTVRWAETNDVMYLTIEVPECKSPEITLTSSSLAFSGTSNKKSYAVTLAFKGTIDETHADTKYTVKGRNIHFHLMKKHEEDVDEDDKRWNRVLENKKLGKTFIKPDFDRWIDEDDEAEGELMFFVCLIVCLNSPLI
jgi:cytosolic prostaglandin-E synthase